MTNLAHKLPEGIEALKDLIPDFAKDIRLNIGVILTNEGAPDLTINQIMGAALASAYTTKNANVISAIENEARKIISEEEVTAAKAAASIMAMNNVYYRSLHLVNDSEIAKLPAKLRMNVIGTPGIAKVDFEIYSISVSAINGCGACLEAHAKEVAKHGITKLGVQSAIRIGAVISAAAQAVQI